MNKYFTKERFKQSARTCLLVLAGSVLFNIGIYTFAKSASFAPGGISGLALIFNYLWDAPIGLTTLALNIPLVLLCWRVVGKRFLLRSAATMVVSSLLMDIVFPLTPVYIGSPFLAAMFSGAFCGAGLALVYMCGSSTGGTDFLILSVKKLRPHFSVGQVSMMVDGVIICVGGLVFGNIDALLYGVICSLACSLMMDKILYGIGSGKLAIIITDKGMETANAINEEIDRGSTLVNAIGTYSGNERHMLLCACAKSQVYRVRSLAHEVSPQAFVMITEASEVFGEGFIEADSSKP